MYLEIIKPNTQRSRMQNARVHRRVLIKQGYKQQQIPAWRTGLKSVTYKTAKVTKDIIPIDREIYALIALYYQQKCKSIATRSPQNHSSIHFNSIHKIRKSRGSEQLFEEFDTLHVCADAHALYSVQEKRKDCHTITSTESRVRTIRNKYSRQNQGKNSNFVLFKRFDGIINMILCRKASLHGRKFVKRAFLAV